MVPLELKFLSMCRTRVVSESEGSALRRRHRSGLKDSKARRLSPVEDPARTARPLRASCGVFLLVPDHGPDLEVLPSDQVGVLTCQLCPTGLTQLAPHPGQP